MQFLQTILNIIIFLLCLSAVVCIHEAGHLAVAKIFNVYCFEYSIGFGPAIFKHTFKHRKKKKKNEEETNLFTASEATDSAVPEEKEYELGETQFTIRALPLGGYVAMAGEDGNETPDGKVIPKERCLNGVNHFKQICIMLAGITMNFILALVLLFVTALIPTQVGVFERNDIVLTEDVKYAANTGLKTGDKILYLYQTYHLYDPKTETKVDVEFPLAEDRTELTSYRAFKEGTKRESYDDLEKNCISYAILDVFTWSRRKLFTLPSTFEGKEAISSSYRTITFTYQSASDGSLHENVTSERIPVQADPDFKDEYGFGYFGITCPTITVQNSFGDAIVEAGTNFSRFFVGIYQALGSLFTPDGWRNVGGIVSVYKMTSEGITSGSASYFIMLWGYISVNLGCFNLLPIPGLDGWQTLIALIESVIRKKLPSKFKNISNTVGLVVMMLLAGLLIIKDLFL